MKRFIGFLRKEFRHILRDRRTMIIIFGLPIAQLLIFGKVISTDIKDAKIAVYDPAQDETSKEITSKLLSSGYFLLDGYLDEKADYEAVFRKGKVKMIVAFESVFDRKLEREGKAAVQLIADASDPNVARMLTAYASGIINDYVMDEKMPGMSLPHNIVPEVRMLFNEDMKSVYMYVPGIMAMVLMLISAMMTSVSIARDKELGTMEILLASPLKPIQIVLGKVAPYMVISILNSTVVILVGVFVFGVPVLGSALFLMLETLLFITLALSIGIFISTIAPNQMIAMFISALGLMLPTILLSGFVFQVENMPAPLQYFSALMPPRWYIIIIKNIMLKGGGIEFVWKETLILITMTVFFIGLSVRNFKTRLE